MNLVTETDAATVYNIPFCIEMGDGRYDMAFRFGYEYTMPEEEAAAEETEEPGQEEQVNADAQPQGEVVFYGIWDNDSADSISLPSRNAVDLANYYGYDIMLSRESFTLENGAMRSGGETLGKPFTLGPDFDMTNTDLPVGTYQMVFVVQDVFGNRIKSAPVEVDWKNAAATFFVETETDSAE